MCQLRTKSPEIPLEALTLQVAHYTESKKTHQNQHKPNQQNTSYHQWLWKPLFYSQYSTIYHYF